MFMPVYMFYVFVGPYLWAAQVLGVITLSVLGWRFPPDGVAAVFQGRTATLIATVLAGIFTVLISPLAIMVALRRNDRDFPTSWTDPFGLACIGQAVLLVGAGVNAFLVHRPR